VERSRERPLHALATPAEAMLRVVDTLRHDAGHSAEDDTPRDVELRVINGEVLRPRDRHERARTTPHGVLFEAAPIATVAGRGAQTQGVGRMKGSFLDRGGEVCPWIDRISVTTPSPHVTTGITAWHRTARHGTARRASFMR